MTDDEQITRVEVEVCYTQIEEGADHSDPDENGVMMSFIAVDAPAGVDVDAYASRVALEEAALAGWLDPWVENICDVD